VNLRSYIAERAAQVEASLDRYTQPGGLTLLETAPPEILEAVRYSLLGGGKRLRPILVLMAAELFGLRPEQVMPTACALEMIHTYSLIHDDLPAMDDDDLRRGRPTNHKVYGEAIAILAGDALLTLAFELLGRQAEAADLPPERALKALTAVAVGAGPAGMVGGQVLDLAWAAKGAEGEQLAQIHRLKTGALFRAALRAGASLGGATEAQLAALDRYADHFGLAFQIQDDILDVIGDAAKTGKGVGRDLKHDKSTYVRRFGLEGAQALARAEVAAAKKSLAPFGDRAVLLEALAEFVVDRDA
jgi:geranylgeranyl diphosphate synthase type II